MPFQFHQRTLDLLNITPQIDPAAVVALDALETLYGKKLPAAVREWYQLQGAPKHLTGNDNPVPVQELGRQYGKYPHLPDDLLLLVVENQAVCYWAVKWDESHDPPVFTVEENTHSPELILHRHADSFSDFVYTRVWDSWIEPYWLETIDEIPYTVQLQELLAQRYTPQTITYNDIMLGGQITYRFSLDHEGQIIAWVAEDSAQVYIASTKEATLISMAADVLRTSKTPDQLDFYSDLGGEEQEQLIKRIEQTIHPQRKIL
jgi:hypothetical protein